ncbi:MAG: stage II sporulation protein D [Clostridiales bacterium]|nr:stage II sporulation protein D [Clostridiales bacterium]
MKKIILLLVGAIFMLIALPYIVTAVVLKNTPSPMGLPIFETTLELPVAESNSIFIEGMPVEAYVIGVVAAEMPALFEEEALKAQAVASRTYAYKHKGSSIENIGQAFITEEEMNDKWGGKFDLYYDKISKAVKDTESEIIVYDGEPIEAVFHSMSAGKTEYARNAWQEDLPYLKSVDSSLDENAQGYISVKKFTETELKSIFTENYKEVEFGDINFLDSFQILEADEAGYVKSAEIKGIKIDAIGLRGLLGLRSPYFSVGKSGSEIIFTTRGYGHGVGMSQTGADLMAEQGYGYKDILKHYYQGVEIQKIG